MKSFKSVIIVLVVATILISGTIGVLAYAYTSKVKTERTIETKQDNERYNKIEANSAAELFAAGNIIIDYENAPEELKELMKVGTTFSYNGNEYWCSFAGYTYRTKHAFRIISKEDAEKILNYVDLESCSYYEAECILKILSRVMEFSTIGTHFITQNCCNGICARIIAGEDRILFVAMRTRIDKPIVVLKSITYSQAKDENLLFPEPGEYKNVFEDEMYADTLEKIFELCNWNYSDF